MQSRPSTRPHTMTHTKKCKHTLSHTLIVHVALNTQLDTTLLLYTEIPEDTQSYTQLPSGTHSAHIYIPYLDTPAHTGTQRHTQLPKASRQPCRPVPTCGSTHSCTHPHLIVILRHTLRLRHAENLGDTGTLFWKLQNTSSHQHIEKHTQTQKWILHQSPGVARTHCTPIVL